MICNKWQECAEEQWKKKKISDCTNHNFSKCIESSDRRSKVKCEERRKKYVLENTERNHVIAYKMDGGIVVPDKEVAPGTCKCDHIFLIQGLECTAVLIELKGVDAAHALKQIHGTCMLFRDFLQTFDHVYGRIVVASSVPNLKAGPDYVNLVRMVRRTFHGNVKIVEKEFFEKDTELNME